MSFLLLLALHPRWGWNPRVQTSWHMCQQEWQLQPVALCQVDTMLFQLQVALTPATGDVQLLIDRWVAD